MPHETRPWFRPSRNTWFVELNKKQHCLGKHPSSCLRRSRASTRLRSRSARMSVCRPCRRSVGVMYRHQAVEIENLHGRPPTCSLCFRLTAHRLSCLAHAAEPYNTLKED
jgi:hypothetical protein